MPAVIIRDLSYRYRGTKRLALSSISLEVGQGDFVVVMGPSEAGKSTLAACINGLVPHFFKGKFQGDVIVLDKNTRAATVAEMSEQVGMVFQDFEAELFSTNVELEVAFGPENFAVSRDEIARRIDENLRLVGLEHLRNRPPSTLSGGQKQKLAIASVLAMNPRVLVMDEPTTDLDPISKFGCFQIADQLRLRDDLTLIVMEHETEEALHAQKIVLLKEGQVVRQGPAGEILRQVDLLEGLGVMPLGVPKYFHAMYSQMKTACASPLPSPEPGESSRLVSTAPESSVEPPLAPPLTAPLPLTPEEGLCQFQANGWRIDEDRYGRLVAGDVARQQTYGDVVIRCQGLEHTYPNGFKALAGIDLQIRRGQVVAIVGQNGSGKTTLVKHFNGLLMPTAGSVDVNGQPTTVQGVYQLGKQVGYVFQNPDHQIFSDTVFDEVAYTLRLRKIADAEIHLRVAEALGAVGLGGFEKEDPFSLTKSGRQRVAVASVLAAQPEVLILDEPTTGLDYAEQRSMMELVRRLNEAGSTIIFVTHHMWVVAEYAHQMYVCKDGRLLLQGAPREVFAHEKELTDAYLRPPHLVRFANLLGHTALTVDELLSCTCREGA
jgi:energy-coupling factor transport system ATP-binding protein